MLALAPNKMNDEPFELFSFSYMFPDTWASHPMISVANLSN
jgi:hypothetical protein